MNKISITHFGNAHGDWLRALDFYTQEIAILRSRLGEIAGKNSLPDVQKQVEHFENQFSIQAENIHLLIHEIKANVALAAQEAAHASAGYIDSPLVAAHKALGEKFKTEENIINELRHSFNLFASEWM